MRVVGQWAQSPDSPYLGTSTTSDALRIKTDYKIPIKLTVVLLRNALQTGLKSKYVRETMIHDLDIYRSAQILIREHGEDAAVEAARSVLITQIKLDLELSALGGGVVELDRHAIGILDEDLVKPQIRHLAVTDGYGLLLQACNHFFEPSSLER